MPIHDWSRVKPGIFHDFHHAWTARIRAALNSGLLPEGYYAMAEQLAPREIADLASLEVAVSEVATPEELLYSVVIRSEGDQLVAIVEIAMPFPSNRRQKVDQWRTAGYEVLVIDPSLVPEFASLKLSRELRILVPLKTTFEDAFAGTALQKREPAIR
jgi:hypothetical protein